MNGFIPKIVFFDNECPPTDKVCKSRIAKKIMDNTLVCRNCDKIVNRNEYEKAFMLSYAVDDGTAAIEATATAEAHKVALVQYQ